MYLVRLQTGEVYGEFITQTEAEILFRRRGWSEMPDDFRTWSITTDKWTLIATLFRGNKEEYLDKELLPKGEAPEEMEDITGRFYRAHFLAI